MASGAPSKSESLGFTQARELWQMRRSLLAPLAEPHLPEGVRLRPFVVGADEPAFLRVNNAAFDWHPEQGGWNLDQVKLRDDVSLTDENLFVLLDKVRRHETIYKQAGAVHGCALADTSGEILMFVEDVGRHNAVDAIAGYMWLDAIDGSDKVFYTTGRLTSEMVIKCAHMRIPFLVFLIDLYV